MACIFCDQTPETENAVEALAAIKKMLDMDPGSIPNDVEREVVRLCGRLKTMELVLERERSRRREAEEIASQYSLENKALHEQLTNEMNRRPSSVVYRGPSSSPSRAARGDDISWHNADAPVHRMADGSVYRAKFGLPYGHTSKKDRYK